MIVAFSTSCPVTSVALIAEDGAVLAHGSRVAPMAASVAAMGLLEELLAECQLSLSNATGFVADLGPGSFTGVRVGVTLAKTFAWSMGLRAAGLSSFDLIDADGTVVLPSRKGEFFIRRAGVEAVRVKELPDEPFVGFGTGPSDDVFPSAAAFARQLARLTWVAPEALLPEYLIEPSISTPKKPYTVAVDG